MNNEERANLTKRERQIMNVLFELGQATAAEVLERLPEPPSYSAVRALLRLLEEKGHVRHVKEGQRYVYRPVDSPRDARRSALREVVRTFFRGSVEQAVAAMVDGSAGKLDDEELDRILALVERARREGR